MAGEGLTPFNRQTAVAFISSQTQKIVSAQVEAADRIIVSQERVASGIDKVGVSVDRVAEGLEGLEAAFEWGFSEIVWHLEQEREVLKDILKVLQAPLDTQAKELRKRAEDAYKNGWVDDALEDFIESEKKNRYDFAVHHSLGNIYFFHKKIPEKALEHYEKAAMYASPKSPYQASLSLLHIGRVKYVQQDFQGAYEAVKKATELSPKLYEGYYECARYCACLGKYDEAITNLHEAIKGDRNYCLKADSEKDFDAMRPQLHSFYSDLLSKAQNEAKDEIAKAQEIIVYVESHGLFTDKSEKFGEAKRTQGEAEQFLSWGSLLDHWDAIDKAWYVQKLTLRCAEDNLSDQISRLTESHSKARGKYEMEKSELKDIWWEGGWIIAILTFFSIFLFIVYPLIGLVLCVIVVVIIYSIFPASLTFHHKKENACYESKIARLQDTLSEVKSKRNQFTWAKKIQERKKKEDQDIRSRLLRKREKLRQKTPIADEFERVIREIEEDEEQ